jgi:hypothetical protein
MDIRVLENCAATPKRLGLEYTNCAKKSSHSIFITKDRYWVSLSFTDKGAAEY